MSAYLSDYLAVARDQLTEMELENKETPPGDERARTQWMIEQIRDMIIKAEVKLGKKQSIDRDIDHIEQSFKKYL